MDPVRVDNDKDDPSIGMKIDEVFKPLSSLEELFKWDAGSPSNLLTASVPLMPSTRKYAVNSNSTDVAPRQSGMRTLVCHDMMGGYLEDSYVQGVSTMSAYRFFHWSQVDIFVYFSHSFLTIPPPVWIDTAHLHGVKILGTLITEGGGGYELCKQLLEGKDLYLLSRFVHKLVEIAEHYKFDGWLINIENKIEEENVKELLNLIHWLTLQMHQTVPGSLVLWYDSVLDNGDLIWQNELNLKNKIYFDACDGIYLNYNWNEDLLEKSARLAGDRLSDVFAGVDVFGRGTFGGGGFDTDVAFKAAQNHGLSVAVFAQGWTYEVLGQLDFLKNDYKFWNRLVEFTSYRAPTELPFYSSFCNGSGRRVYRNGEIVHSEPWSNLSLQQYQMNVRGILDESEDHPTISIYSEDAYHGGSSLAITGNLNVVERERTFKIFQTYLKCNSSLQVSYTTKCINQTTDNIRMCLLMTATSENGLERRKYRLVQCDREIPLDDVGVIDQETILHPTKISFNNVKNVNVEECNSDSHVTMRSHNGWITRYFCFTLGTEDAIIITDFEVCISGTWNLLKELESNFEVLIGQLQVVPLELLSDQPPLEVNCLLVETCRTSSAMDVTSLIKWNGGSTSNLVDSYDIFCQLKWTLQDDSTLDETNKMETATGVLNYKSKHWKSETRYVGTTKRQLYKMNSFPMSNPQTTNFRLRFIIRENVIGRPAKDIDQAAFCDVTL